MLTIRFRNPPVVEVVCGIVFSKIEPLFVPHFGLYWELIRSEFPVVQEVPPIMDGEFVQFSDIPPLPRIWFTSVDQHHVIQLQKDRFLYNWRKSSAESEYPSFKTIYPKFKQFLETFVRFIREDRLGEVTPRRFELSYINHIEETAVGHLLNRVSDTLLDHRRDATRKRFLPEPVGINWTTEYALPNDAGSLTTAAQFATKLSDSTRILRIDLTARGIQVGSDANAMDDWFQIAHEWIVGGFSDLTDELVQRGVWGREQ